MDHFEYRDGVLYAEDVNLVDLAETVGTPFYCYSTATLRHHYGVLHNACAKAGLNDTLICYSVKANSNIGVIARWRASARARISSHWANCNARWRQALCRKKLCFQVSAKPMMKWQPGSKPVSGSSMSKALPSLTSLPRLQTGWAKPLKWHSGSIRMSMRVRMKNFTGKAENKFGIAWEDAQGRLRPCGWAGRS